MRRGLLPIGLLVLAGWTVGEAWQARQRVWAEAMREGDGHSVTVRGVVAGPGYPLSGPGRGGIALPVRVTEWGDEGTPASLGIRAVLRGGGVSVAPGRRLILHGEWRGPPPRGGPGGRDRWSSWQREGVSGVLLVRPGGVKLLDWAGGLRGWVYQWRRSLGMGINRLYPESSAALLYGLILGERRRLDPTRQEAFRRSGLVHLLAVSGLHVGIILGALRLVLGLVGLRRRRLWIGLGLGILFYLAATGLKPPLVRAGTMALLAAVAWDLRRQVAATDLLGTGGLLVLILWPGGLRDPAVLLSFAATAALVFGYPTLQRFLPRRSGRWRWGRPPVALLLVSALATAATAPLTLSLFHRLSLVAIPANLLAVPVVALILPSAFLSLALLPLLPGLAGIYASVTDLLIQGLLGYVDWMAGHPWAEVRLPGLHVWELVILYGGVVLILQLRRPERQRLGLFLLLAGFVARVWVPIVFPGPALRAIFLDVGQGDAAVFETRHGGVVVVDGGPAHRGWDAGRGVVAPYLWSRGHRTIDLVVLTHPEADHAGGLAYLVEQFDVGILAAPGGRLPETLEEACLVEGIVVRPIWRGERLRLEDLNINVLHPTPAWLVSPWRSANDWSVVLKMEAAGGTLLLTGDAGVAVEDELVERSRSRLRASVLKVGHHGSRTSSSQRFLAAVSPSVAIVSAGRHNLFGHPHPDVVSRLAGRRVQLLRTDQDGTITVEIRSRGIEIHAQRGLSFQLPISADP